MIARMVQEQKAAIRRAFAAKPPPFRQVLCRDCGLSYEEVNPTLEQANRVAGTRAESFGRCPRCGSTRHQFVEHLQRDDGQDDVIRLNPDASPPSHGTVDRP